MDSFKKYLYYNIVNQIQASNFMYVLCTTKQKYTEINT